MGSGYIGGTDRTPVPLTLPREAGFSTVTFADADSHQRLWLGSGNRIGILTRMARSKCLAA